MNSGDLDTQARDLYSAHRLAGKRVEDLESQLGRSKRVINSYEHRYTEWDDTAALHWANRELIHINYGIKPDLSKAQKRNSETIQAGQAHLDANFDEYVAMARAEMEAHMGSTALLVTVK